MYRFTPLLFDTAALEPYIPASYLDSLQEKKNTEEGKINNLLHSFFLENPYFEANGLFILYRIGILIYFVLNHQTTNSMPEIFYNLSFHNKTHLSDEQVSKEDMFCQQFYAWLVIQDQYTQQQLHEATSSLLCLEFIGYALSPDKTLDHLTAQQDESYPVLFLLLKKQWQQWEFFVQDFTNRALSSADGHFLWLLWDRERKIFFFHAERVNFIPSFTKTQSWCVIFVFDISLLKGLRDQTQFLEDFMMHAVNLEMMEFFLMMGLVFEINETNNLNQHQ